MVLCCVWQYNKVYGSTEERQLRFTVFQENLDRIAAQNAAEAATGGSAVFGVTKFADLTPGEFALQYKGYKRSSRVQEPRAFEEPEVCCCSSWILDHQHK
jgi:hypothetical protein